MLDSLLVIDTAQFLLRDVQALTFGHTAPAFALASTVIQTTWILMRGTGVPSSGWCAVGLIARIGLNRVIFAALPPGSRFVVLLLDRAARSGTVRH